MPATRSLWPDLHGVGGEFGDGDDGVGDGLVGEDGLHGGDGLGELLLDEVLHVILRRAWSLMQGYGMVGWMSKELFRGDCIVIGVRWS